MITILLIFVVCAIIISYFLYFFKRSHIKLLNNIPGPPSLPIFGNLLDFPRKPDAFWKEIRKLSQEYYPIYRLWGSYIATVNLLCPQDIEIVLSNPKHNKKSWIYRCLHPWLGTGLLTSSGWKWHNRRKILTPAFHFNILQQFISVFTEQSDLLVEVLKDECDKPYTVIGPLITKFTLGTVCETAMGTRLDSSNESQNNYINAIHKMGRIIVYRVARPWLFLDLIYKQTCAYRLEKKLEKTLHDFSMSVIKNRQANFKSNIDSKKKLAMLDLLLSAKNNGEFIDDIGIREEVDTFMFEGHDTTAACLTFTLMLLACHRDVQDEVVQELKMVLNGENRKLTFTDLQNLRYLERVLKESLRMYPSVPFIGRVAGEDILTYTGYKIPLNCNINIHIFDLHYNPEIYPDPYKFDPDRFLPENSQNRHPFAYLPFSAGPRNCIGQKFAMLELKSVISSILIQYILEPVDKPEDICLTTDLVLRSLHDVKIKISRRPKAYFREEPKATG